MSSVKNQPINPLRAAELLKGKEDETKTEDLEKSLSYVPMNVYSFSELDRVEAVYEYKEELFETFHQFIQIAENIVFDFPQRATELFLPLVVDFINRLQQLEMQNDEMMKSVKKGSIALFKGKDGSLYWVGVPTNKFIDRDNDIIADAAHQEFVKALESGDADYPTLNIWHIPVPVGNTQFVDYDPRGFLVAGGKVKKEYETLVKSLVENATEVTGMSHLVPAYQYELDSDGVVIKYRSKEFSLLPNSEAANQLTAFTVKE